MSDIGSVEVSVDLDSAAAVAQSKIAGEAMGKNLEQGVDKGFNADLAKKLNASINNPKLRKVFHEAGQNLGTDFGDGFRGVNKDTLDSLNASLNSPKTRARFSKAGANLGSDFGGGFRGVNKSLLDDINANLNSPKTRRAFNLAGTDAGSAFSEGKSVALRRGFDDDERETRSFLSRFRGLFSKAGDESGNGFGSGFMSGFRRSFSRISSIIIGVTVVFGETLVQVLAGAAGAVVSLTGSLLNAGAAGLALIPIIAGLGGLITTAVIGFSGFGEALSSVNDAFKDLTSGEIDMAEYMETLDKALANLSPSAASVVRLFSDLRPALAEFQGVIQERLFEGLADDLRGFAEQLPQFQNAFGQFADVLNSFFAGVINIGAEADLPGLFAGLAPVVDSVLDGVRNLISAFLSFVEGATPAAGRLGAIFQGWTSEFNKFIERVSGNGDLDSFLQRAIDSFQEWMDLLGSAGQLFGTIFSAGLDTGDGFLVKLTEIIDNFNDFLNTDTGQSSLSEFFAASESIMSSLGTVLGGVAAGFKNLLDPETVGRFDVLAESLATVFEVLGSVLNVLGDAQVLTTFAEALAMMAEMVAELLPVIQPLADAVGQLLQSGLELLAPVLEAIAGIAAIVVPYFVDFIDTLRESGVIGVFADILVFLAETAGEFLSVLGESGILDTFAGLIVFLAEGLAQLLEAVSPIIPPLLEFARKVLPPLFKGISKILDAGLDVLISLFDTLAPIVVILLDALAPLVEKLLPALADAVSQLFEALGPLLESLGEALADALIALLPLLEPLIDAFIELLPSIVAMSTAMFPLITLFLQFVGPIATVAASILALLIPAIDGIVLGLGIFVDVFTGIVDIVAGVVESIIGFFQDLYDTLVGNSIIPDLINGIIDWFTGLPLALLQIVGDMVLGLVGLFVDLATEVPVELAKMALEGLGKVTGFISDVTGKVASFVADIPAKFSAMVRDILGFLGNLFVLGVRKFFEISRDFAAEVGKGIQKIIDFFIALPGRIVGFVTGLAGNLIGLGADLIGWIVDGIEANAFRVANAIRGAIPGGGFLRNLLPFGLGQGFGDFTGSGLPGGAAGGLFSKATPIVIGEAGREALVPLDRPLGMVDPAVRSIAALVRGETGDRAYPHSRAPQGVVPTSSTTHNHNWNIQGTSDPEAQAHKIMNRLVAAL